MSEESVLGALSADKVRAHVEHIALEIPGRLAGSENGKRMAEYSAKALQDSGVAAQVYELPGLVSFPGAGEFRMLAPNEVTIPANTLGHSLPTLEEGISGTLVDVYSGAFSDYEGKDVVGKITMSELSYSPGPPREAADRRPARLDRPDHDELGPPGERGPAVRLGQARLGQPHARELQEPDAHHPLHRHQPGRRPATARAAASRARSRSGSRPMSRTAGGRCRSRSARSRRRAARISSASAATRTPGPGQAATDNAAGNACMMELARVFNQHRDKLRRGLMFGFWTGHETGTMIGSSWFVDRNWDQLREHMMAYLQIDQPACVGTTRWGTSSNVEMKRFHQAVERKTLGNIPTHWRRAAKNGDSSFFGLGVPMMHGEGSFTEEELQATALATLGWWHHSLENTLDKLDWAWMATHLQIYGAYLWELCTAPVLPFEFMSVAEQFEERLHGPGAGRPDDRPGRCAGAREGLSARRRHASTRWRCTGARDTPRATSPMARPSRSIAACRRSATCWCRCRARRSAPTARIPMATRRRPPCCPACSTCRSCKDLPDGEQRWMLETQLVRQRNRVADALADATALIDDTLAHLELRSATDADRLPAGGPDGAHHAGPGGAGPARGFPERARGARLHLQGPERRERPALDRSRPTMRRSASRRCSMLCIAPRRAMPPR